MRHLVEKADVVLADLPCSGLGVLGKKDRSEIPDDARSSRQSLWNSSAGFCLRSGSM